MGTYVHGLFHSGCLRRGILNNVAARKGVTLPPAGEEFSQAAEYDKLADLVRSSLDMDAARCIAGLVHDQETV